MRYDGSNWRSVGVPPTFAFVGRSALVFVTVNTATAIAADVAPANNGVTVATTITPVTIQIAGYYEVKMSTTVLNGSAATNSTVLRILKNGIATGNVGNIGTQNLAAGSSNVVSLLSGNLYAVNDTLGVSVQFANAFPTNGIRDLSLVVTRVG